MARKRRVLSSQFKAKVAMAAAKEDNVVQKAGKDRWTLPTMNADEFRSLGRRLRNRSN